MNGTAPHFIAKLVVAAILSGCFTSSAPGQGLPAGATAVPSYLDRGECINAWSAHGANGTQGDSARIQAALQRAAREGGRCVYLPALSKAYFIDIGLNLPAGVALVGEGTMNFSGMSATVPQWAAKGTWLLCADSVKPCVSMSGHGSTFEGINLIWDQSIPPDKGDYNPVSFPDGLHITATLFRVRHSLMVGGTRCINIDYTEKSGGGTYSQIEDVKLGCLKTGIRWSNVNDVIYARDIDVRPLWHAMSETLVAYVLAHLTGMDINYLDNPVINGYQCFLCNAAFKFTDGVAVGNRHSLYNGQLANIQCSLVRICMMTSSSTTTLSFNASNFLAQQNQATGRRNSDTLFQLGTDNVDANFTNVSVISTGGKVMAIGGGSRGAVRIGMLALGTRVVIPELPGYSTVAAGQSAFEIATGGSLAIGQRSVVRTDKAGPFIAGAGADSVQMPTYCWNVITTRIGIDGTGEWTDFTVGNQMRSQAHGSWLQMRLSGILSVTTNQSMAAAFRMGNYPEVVVEVTASGTRGVRQFDTGWIEVRHDANMLGRVQHRMANGVARTLEELMVCAR